MAPSSDHAQNKMRLARVVSGFVVPSELKDAVKAKADFLKVIRPFYFTKVRALPGESVYLLVSNSL